MHGMTDRGRRRWRWGAAMLAVASLIAACGGSGDDDVAGDESDRGDPAAVLGERNPASGEPVKIGTVGDGQTPAFDNTSQLTVAQAMVEYINEYRGGIGGRPIELVSCETNGDESASLDCATELIQEDIAMAVLPPLATTATVWRELDEAGIPVFIFSATDPEVLSDRDSTFLVGSPTATLVDLPATVAEENDAEKVVAVIIDVPAATAIYEGPGEDLFGEAGLDLELVRVPPGQPDMTSQMADIAAQDDVHVHIVGTDAFAIAAVQGLEAAAYDGSITCIGCDTEAARTALGASLEGVTVSAQGRSVDDDTGDVDLWHAIVDTYAPDLENPDDQVPVFSYLVWATARDALDELTGEVTRENILTTITSMPNMRLRMFGGAQFRCNGNADPQYPAACANASLSAVLDESGQPGEVSVTNTDPIPD
jgi:branched-chain amino acid transport system substrate-binding protein